MAKDKKTSISVQGTMITILSHQQEDYISLTDMTKKFGDDGLIYSWMRNRNTVEFLEIWEHIHNPNFKGANSRPLKNRLALTAST